MKDTKVFRTLSTKGKTSIRNGFIRKSYNQIYDKNYENKINPIQAMKALRRNGGTAPLILIFVTRCKCVVNLTPRPLYQRERTLLYPLNRGLSGPQSRCGPCGEEIHLLRLL
jgi:hypothetical protein